MMEVSFGAGIEGEGGEESFYKEHKFIIIKNRKMSKRERKNQESKLVETALICFLNFLNKIEMGIS